MSYAEDFEDVGGYFAEQDYYAEECDEYEGECKRCPHKKRCQSSDYNKRRLRQYGILCSWESWEDEDF